MGQLGIITAARRKNNMNREVAMLENESMRGHELESEGAAMRISTAESSSEML